MHQTMKNKFVITFTIIILTSFSIFAKVTPPNLSTRDGYIALLLINEVPFPGEGRYKSMEETKLAMVSILAVLDNRLKKIPSGYTQKQIATIIASDIIDVITAGGERGQVDGFYHNSQGKKSTVPRVMLRVNYLTNNANKGKPGKFAELLNFAGKVSKEYVNGKSVKDIFAELTFISPHNVTGSAYSWMTDSSGFHPRGSYILIPDIKKGSQGGNRFFTLKKK